MTIEKKKIRPVLTENYWLKSGNILGIFWEFSGFFKDIFWCGAHGGFGATEGRNVGKGGKI